MAIDSNCSSLIEISADGIEFASLGTVELDQAAETVVDMQAAVAQSVRITALSNWGGLFLKYGLSEVRLLAIPNAARELSPTDGVVNVDPTTAVLTCNIRKFPDITQPNRRTCRR